jgi:hypothetical protein
LVVQVLVLNQDIDDRRLVHNKVFKDPNGDINPVNKEVKLDLFCDEPLIIGECTSVCNTLAKVESFVKKKSFVQKHFPGKEMKAFFLL